MLKYPLCISLNVDTSGMGIFFLGSILSNNPGMFLLGLEVPLRPMTNRRRLIRANESERALRCDLV